MLSRSLCLIATLLLFGGPLDAHAGSTGYDQRFGNVLFAIPPGWVKVEEGGFAIVTPAEASRDVAIFVTEGEDYSGDLARWLRETVATGEANEQVFFRSDVQRYEVIEPYTVLLMQSRTRNKEGQNLERLYLAANPGGRRAELVVYVATNQQAFERGRPSLEQFIGSMEFANLEQAGAAPPNPIGPKSKKQAPPAAQAPGKSGTGKNCRVVQRQQCSGGVGTSLGYFCNTRPETVCN